MIYYHGYPTGHNMGDDAVFRSFVLSLSPNYRKYITTNPKGCKLAVLGGGSLITNQKENAFKYFVENIKVNNIKSTFAFGVGYDEIDCTENYNWIPLIPEYFKEEDFFVRGIKTLEKIKFGSISGDSALADDLLLGATKYGEYGKFNYAASYGESPGRYDTKAIKDRIYQMTNGESLILMPVCPEDKILMKKDFPNAPCLDVLPYPEYVRFIKENVNFMFTMKLHSTIAAFKSGKSYESFNYRFKCDDFQESRHINNIDLMREILNEKIRKLETT